MTNIVKYSKFYINGSINSDAEAQKFKLCPGYFGALPGYAYDSDIKELDKNIAGDHIFGETDTTNAAGVMAYYRSNTIPHHQTNPYYLARFIADIPISTNEMDID